MIRRAPKPPRQPERHPEDDEQIEAATHAAMAFTVWLCIFGAILLAAFAVGLHAWLRFLGVIE